MCVGYVFGIEAGGVFPLCALGEGGGPEAVVEGAYVVFLVVEAGLDFEAE